MIFMVCVGVVAIETSVLIGQFRIFILFYKASAHQHIFSYVAVHLPPNSKIIYKNWQVMVAGTVTRMLFIHTKHTHTLLVHYECKCTVLHAGIEVPFSGKGFVQAIAQVEWKLVFLGACPDVIYMDGVLPQAHYF